MHPANLSAVALRHAPTKTETVDRLRVMMKRRRKKLRRKEKKENRVRKEEQITSFIKKKMKEKSLMGD